MLSSSLSATLLLLLGPLLQGAAPGGYPQADRRASPTTVFLGASGGSGELRTYDAEDGRDLGARLACPNLELLPIDFVGRTQLERGLADRPRYLPDVPGASRLELPQGRGMLYRFRRDRAGVWSYGFLLMRPDGRRNIVGEVVGTGVQGNQDPYLDRVAVAPDGRSILAATKTAARGDLVEIHLASGRVELRTRSAPPEAFSRAGLWLGQDWGFGVSASGVWRFPRTPGSVAQRVPFEPGEVPSYFSGQAIMSAGRVHALVTAGTAADALFPYVIGNSGRAVRADETPSPISDAGYLPEAMAGPRMAVSDDGLMTAWSVDTPLSREAYCARLDLAPEGQCLTGDTYFTNTLDETGVFGIFGMRLLMGIGDDPLDGQSGLESMDFFEVELMPDLTPQFTNLTLSSGVSQPPFLVPGTIEVDWMLRVPEANAYLLYDGNGERVLAIDDGQSTPRLLLGQVKDIYWIEPAGDWIAFAARRSFDPRPRELYRVPLDLGLPANLLVPGNDDLDHLRARGRSNGRLVFQTSTGPGLDWTHQVQVDTGAWSSHPAGPGLYGSTLGFTPHGQALVRLGPEGGTGTFEVWSGGATRVQLQTVPGPGWFVPGQ